MRQLNLAKSRSTALLGAVVECISMAVAVNRRFLIKKIISSMSVFYFGKSATVPVFVRFLSAFSFVCATTNRVISCLERLKLKTQN